MGDTDPGSIRAAQSALPENLTPVLPNAAMSAKGRANTSEQSKPGFFARLFGLSTAEPQTSTPSAGPAPLQRPGMINLRKLRVDDVAVPRADIVAVSQDITKSELVETFRESGNTRLPVYDGTLDLPVGLVHLKDFALGHGFNGKGERYDLKKMLRPLLYAPPSMPIGILLQKMQSERMHMALVIDEYGGVDGLVTLEDLVEQVIGEIEDEHDIDEDLFWARSGQGIYIAQAKAPLEEFENDIGMRLADDETEEEIDTLGGLVFVLAGRVPVRGEVIPHASGAEFEIIDADPRRVKRIRVRLPSAVQAKKAAEKNPAAEV